MKAHRQPSIYDLLQPDSYQRLTGVFAQFSINIDPRTLLSHNTSRESILSQVLNDLASSPKLLSFAQAKHDFDATDTQEILSEKKNIEDTKIYSFMRCLLLYTLSEEAALSHFKVERLREMHRELRLLLIALASKEYERQLIISETEKQKIQQIERELTAMLQDAFHHNFDSHFHQLVDIHSKVHDYNKALGNIKEQKHTIQNQIKEDSAAKVNELKSGIPELAHIQDEHLADIVYKARNKINKNNAKMNKYNLKNEHLVKQNAKIDLRLLALDEKEQELNNQERNEIHQSTPFIAQKHDKTVRIPETRRMEIQEERNKLQMQREALLAQKQANNKLIEKRDQKRVNIKVEPKQVIESMMAKPLDDSLAQLFSDAALKEKFGNKLGEMLAAPADVDAAYIANRKEKHGIKIEKREMVKAAEALAVEQLAPLERISAIQKANVNAQAPQDAALAHKEKRIQQMVESIQIAAHKPSSQEKIIIKMDKLNRSSHR